MSLQFSVSKNGPPNNTNKTNKRITEYNDILRWKGVEGPSEKGLTPKSENYIKTP